ncbi:hypothetical protein AX15_007572 [Amanita polypyramis BW_CC]|nr:hypothetical protein AX15_007572 [Amanita polypyramis BW_CC]
MKAKNVHFALYNTCLVSHSRAPEPPSSRSTSTDSSSSGSNGPSPPLSILPGPTPYAVAKKRRGTVTAGAGGASMSISIPRNRAVSLTGSQATRVKLHALLEFSPSTVPAIKYDLVDMPVHSTLRLPSSYMRGSTRSSSILNRVLDEPATIPPIQSMTIACPHMPWVIRVFPSSSPPSPSRLGGQYITIRDILTELYTSLRVPIVHAEYAMLPSERARERAGKAYKRRYRRLQDERAYEEEKIAGLRRVDFLMECTRFAGLSLAPPGTSASLRKDEWVLNVE